MPIISHDLTLPFSAVKVKSDNLNLSLLILSPFSDPFPGSVAGLYNFLSIKKKAGRGPGAPASLTVTMRLQCGYQGAATTGATRTIPDDKAPLAAFRRMTRTW